ncbi:MAG: hypothetical protein HZA50_18090 [Planctomycetes bacterium]|nr:hypothetical protein [Planctomycetota bacterium]
MDLKQMADTNIKASQSQDCGTFLLDVVGQFDYDDLAVKWTSANRRSNGEIDALIESTWKEAAERSVRENRMLYNGNLCRLVDIGFEGPKLLLTLGPVTFQEFLGTNLTHSDLRLAHGQDVLADPLGVSAAITTNDQFVFMGLRSQKVFYHAGRIHPIGGVLELSQPQGPLPNPFRAMVDELAEEVNLPGHCVKEIVCVGLVRDKHIVQPELIFDVAINADFEAVRCAVAQAKDSGEHVEFIPIRNHPAAVVSFIEQRYVELTAVGLATLLLHGLKHWGSGWFASTQGYLRSLI